MKVKQLLFGGLLFGAFSLTAFQSEAQGKFGVNAGVNFANITGKDAPDNNSLKTGFQAGITYDIGIADDFVIQPGLSYVQNGTQYDGTFLGKADPKVYLNYLQLPVTFQYQPELGTGRLLLGVGPYVGMGIGDVKLEAGSTSISDSWENSFINKFDAGGKLLAGYQMGNGLSLNLNANLGLLKLSDVNNPPTTNNTSFGVTVGFKF